MKAKVCKGCKKYECDDYPYWTKVGNVMIQENCILCKHFKKFDLNRNRCKDLKKIKLNPLVDLELIEE